MTQGYTPDLISREMHCLTRGICPDCGYRGFILGPRGGAAINIECGNLECRARFNVATGPFPTIIFADRIARESEGGAKWEWTKL